VSVKEGDHVLLPEYGGSQIKLDDKEFHLFRDEDILGILRDWILSSVCQEMQIMMIRFVKITSI